MNFDYSKSLRTMKDLFLQNVVFSEPEFENHLRMLLRETDQFHPFNYDGEFSKALNEMPKYCNYRNYTALIDYRNLRDMLEDSICSCLEEMIDLVNEYYENAYNFAHGEFKHVTISFKKKTSDLTVVVASRIIRTCKA